MRAPFIPQEQRLRSRAWSRALARWCAGVPWPSPPFPASCPCRQHHHSVSNAPSSNRTGPFRSSGFPTVFTAWRAEAMHDRAVELVEPRLLEEGGRECPKALATSFVLPPQEVHELGVDVRVHLLEMPVGVAEAGGLTPAPKTRVQRPNFRLETVEVIVPDRIADLVSDAAHRFRRRPAIAEASFRVAAHRHEPKVHPEKVESIGGVDSTRLLRAQGQTQAPDDVLQPAKPRLRVSSAENHQVVTVANQFRSAHPRLPFDVESMQICVRDQWRNHTALWRTRDHRPHGSVFQDARLQPSTNKAQYPRVTDTPSNRGDQALMGQRVKARFQISVDDLTRAPRDIRLNLADGFAGAPLRTEAVRAVAEVRFQDGFNHQFDCRLYDAVANRRNAEPTTLVRFSRLRDVHPSDVRVFCARRASRRCPARGRGRPRQRSRPGPASETGSSTPGLPSPPRPAAPGTLVDSCLSRYPPASVSSIVLPLARLFLPIIPLDYTLRNGT